MERRRHDEVPKFSAEISVPRCLSDQPRKSSWEVHPHEFAEELLICLRAVIATFGSQNCNERKTTGVHHHTFECDLSDLVHGRIYRNRATGPPTYDRKLRTYHDLGHVIVEWVVTTTGVPASKFLLIPVSLSPALIPVSLSRPPLFRVSESAQNSSL